MPIPDRAGPRGWYRTQQDRPFFWTGKIHPTRSQGLCYLLQIQRHGPNGSERKIVAAKHWIDAATVRRMTSGKQDIPFNFIDGLPTAEAVKVAEDAR